MVYQIMWKNTVDPAGPQVKIWRMRIACWKPKATNRLSEYVILIAFPLQQWLQERASMLRHKYNDCRVKTETNNWNQNEKNTLLEFILVNFHMSTPCNATFIYIKLSLSKSRRRIGTSEVQLHSFVTSAVDGGECSTSRPGKEHCYPANRRVGGPQNRSVEENDLLPLMGFEPQIVQPVTPSPYWLPVSWLLTQQT